MAIQKEFIVRYRTEGHVRFQIPSQATQEQLAVLITDGISKIAGVISVNCDKPSRKLIIRYQENICDFIALATQMHSLLATLEQQGWFAPQAVVELGEKSRFGLKHKLKSSKINRWLGAQITSVKETAKAAKIIGKLGSRGPKALVKNPEKAIIDFLNDILVLYLIKTHWTRITQQWLVKPFVHRYEWMAMFYLFFLLVRSRKPK